MPSVTCSGSGVTLIRLARTLVPSQSTTRGHEGDRDPGRGEGHDGEGPHLARGRDVDLLELGPAAAAQALRRSKKRAPHAVHSLATRCGSSPSSR